MLNVLNWVNVVNFPPASCLANSLIMVHTRPRTTGLNCEDQRQSNGYSALWDYKFKSCMSTLLQPKMAIECACMFERGKKLKLLTGSWTEKDTNCIILWDL